MACSSGDCQSSGCYKDEDNAVPSEAASPPTVNPSLPNDAVHNSGRNICIKCKASDALAVAGDDGRFCHKCFRNNLFGKFKFAITSNAMISTSDKVLVALSGGQSSRVALQFVHEMQYKAQKNFNASRDRSLPVFGVGVAFVDESAISPVELREFEKSIEVMRSIVSELAPPEKTFHVVPIERAYSMDFVDGRDRLKVLLDAVTDITGKEDLLMHLRMLALQKVAIDFGYSKLVLGSCTSKIACHVISATVKGQGYSLPADIQYVDARWEIPVVLPLRDCLARELNLLCQLDGLKTVRVLEGPSSGINGLVSSFVTLLQKENPSRESTILRTAGKLTPFQFNKNPETEGDDVSGTLQRRLKRFGVKTNNSIYTKSFCPVCNSPLSSSNVLGLSNLKGPNAFRAACCSSCQFQIVPRDPTSLEHFYSFLPESITVKANDSSNGASLREQIQDFLLSDTEDDS